MPEEIDLEIGYFLIFRDLRDLDLDLDLAL